MPFPVVQIAGGPYEEETNRECCLTQKKLEMLSCIGFLRLLDHTLTLVGGLSEVLNNKADNHHNFRAKINEQDKSQIHN